MPGAEIRDALQRAHTCLQRNEVPQAIAVLQSVLARSPGVAPALALMSEASGRAGDSAQALEYARKAVVAAPSEPAFTLRLAQLLIQSDLPAEAIEPLRTLIKQAPGLADARAALGVALQQSGDLESSVSAYEGALKLQPNAAQIHFNLGSALKRIGRFDEATTAHRRAVELQPRNPQFNASLAVLLVERSQFEDAAQALERTLLLAPDQPELLGYLAYTCKRLKDGPKAVRVAQRLDEVAPNRRSSLNALSAAYLCNGDAAAAKLACEAALQLAPDDRNALSDLVFARSALGDIRAAQDLIDLDHLLYTETIPCPAGWSSLQAFNDGLVTHVLSHTGVSFANIAISCHHGETSGELLVEPKGPLQHLEQAIRAAAGRYRNALPVNLSHPWLAHLPQDLELSAWMTRLRTQGFQYGHNHPTAHISGVYYVQLPDAVRNSAPEGWIEFGRAPGFYNVEHQGEIRNMEPEAGRLFLFPSYLFHRTIPFDSEQERITIAFDLRTAENSR